MALDWPDVGKIAFTSSVFSTIVTAIIEYFRRGRGYKRDARYLALRMAVILEKFSIDCANVISGNELYRSPNGHAGELCLALPNLAAFPADADWKVVDPDLAGRALGLPNEIAL